MSNVTCLLQILEDSLDRPSMVHNARIINNTYTTFMNDSSVWQMVFAVFHSEVHPLLLPASESSPGHRFVSELLLRYYPAERVVKYHIVKEHLREPDEITIFEMYVDSSRVDLARVNGQSYAVEVKTEYDRLDKLSKQVEDYAKVFEHVGVVVHESHLDRLHGIIPKFCGVATYRIDGTDCAFSTVKPHGTSPLLSAEAQVRNLSSRDLSQILRSADLSDPGKKEERAELVLRHCSAELINHFFKLVVKAKYREKWAFLQDNFDRIEAVDVQSFYRAQADPQWVYCKYSPMV